MNKESLYAGFPDKWEDFISQYVAAVDGDTGEELVSLYRVKQMMWYYMNKDYLRLGTEYSTNDYEIMVAADPSCDLRTGSPRFKIVRRLT